MSEPAPTAIPGYRLIRELGRGGMATVWLAVQESLGREVALKLLSPQLAADPAASERFLREGRIAAGLVHRHIVGIHDVGVYERQPYLAMEFMPGGAVSTDAPYPANAALDIVREIALALEHAHSEGVIHRDLKPENILRRKDGSHALADFGIARTRDSSSTLTQEGVTIGTPHYMSPEQLQALPLDGRADLYSLGVVLYQLLTGQLPYRGTEGVPVGMQHINAPIPRLPDALSRFQPLLDSLLAKSPAQRPASGAELAHRIEGLQATLTPLSVPTQVLEPVPARRQPWRWAVLGLALFLAGGAWYFSAHRGKVEVAANPVAPAAVGAAAQANEHGIAVLPLLNIGGNPDNEYFSDGLSETLLDMLSHVSGLKVIARSSSFAFKGKDADARAIGKALGVSHLLEGSVQQAGGKVRITMQLVNCDDGSQLWSQRYDRDLADVFKVQDEIASEVVKALQGALPQAQRAQITAAVGVEDVAAYQEYLKGNALLPQRKPDELREALTHFEKAIAIDPGFARAYVGAADTLSFLSAYAEITPEQDRRWQNYVQRALELAPELGEAHIAAASRFERSSARNVDAAEREYRRGIELAPSYASGYHWYARLLMYDRSDADAALPVIDKALALNPLAPAIQWTRAQVLVELGRSDEARAYMQSLLRADPDSSVALRTYGDQEAILGDLVEALRADARVQTLSAGDQRNLVQTCFILLRFSALAEAEACAARAKERFGTSSTWTDLRVMLDLTQNDYPAALARLEGQDPSQRSPYNYAELLNATGHNEQALTVYRGLLPALLSAEPDAVKTASPYDLLQVGTALLHAGRQQQGLALLRAGLARSLALKHYGGVTGRGWFEVYFRTLLGRPDAACNALRQAVNAGVFNNAWQLDTDPMLAPLRAQACYAPTMARVRTRMQGQLQAARAAGLLAAFGSK